MPSGRELFGFFLQMESNPIHSKVGWSNQSFKLPDVYVLLLILQMVGTPLWLMF